MDEKRQNGNNNHGKEERGEDISSSLLHDVQYWLIGVRKCMEISGIR